MKDNVNYLRYISLISIIILFFLCDLISEVRADTVYLKNGREMEGKIKKENEEGVVLDVGIGKVRFNWDAIEGIEKTGSNGPADISKYKKKAQHKMSGKEDVGFSSKDGGMIEVYALLNNKVVATLLLDTGASSVLVSNRIVEKLGLTPSEHTIESEVADGRKIQVKYVLLDSVKVEGVEAKDVGAMIFPDDGLIDSLGDGLLGMSFLKKFDFRIDNVNKKLVLERLKVQEIVEKGEDFSVSYPSDWEKNTVKGALVFSGPVLSVGEDGPEVPAILIEKAKEEIQISASEAMRENYFTWKENNDGRHSMLEFLEESFKENFSEDEFEYIYSDFEEKEESILFHAVVIEKKTNRKMHATKVITKEGPVKGYALMFACLEKYYYRYLPVFERCVGTFSINEK